MKWIQHFNTITKHRLLVMKYCFKCGVCVDVCPISAIEKCEGE